ncbi:hypothetical protein GCM10007939_12180 [Amylibacter marinus]|uniref:Hint domain-containing protein n=1 Tax=Amylibacter marinus TaxID=1475483 RepID=A0ABQ5VUD2_9RHOB|nr:Hint domain-containing protein [Amylibacter marinus]GLQ34935.1 hypothetical protein GCM10007939_12180 [Amylibacter marinus]
MLAPGDLMFVGFDSDNNDAAMLATTHIAAGEVIYFTDNEWDGTEFVGNEQLMEWVVPAGGIPAGTVITIDMATSPGSATIDAGGTFNYLGGGGSLAGSNEMLWIVQGTVDGNGDLIPDNFVGVIGNEDNNNHIQSPDLSGTGLTESTGAVIIDGDNDYMEFTGDVDLPDPVTPAELIAAISDTDNWSLGNGGGNNNPNGSGFDVNLPTVICFTKGTLIRTPHGNRKIEDLCVGDQVITHDNGVQHIRWIGRRLLKGKFLHQHPHLTPITLRKHALGENCPSRDITVSPQHRMLMRGVQAQLLFGTGEVLAAAKGLVNGQSIVQEPAADVEYIHILFDQHELLYANGCVSESFFPADHALFSMEAAARSEILELFPELRVAPDGFGPAARLCLRPFEASLISPNT